MPVSSEKEEKLAAELKRLGIREEDLEETFIRGSGAGGQKINKTSSCVRLQHLPSGLEVRCQDSRSQSLNRYHARQRLVELMLEKKEGEKSKRQQKAEKIRRQKRRRSRRSKEKMLKEKKRQAAKKQLRGTPGLED